MVLGPPPSSVSLLESEVSQPPLGSLPDRKLITSWGRLARVVHLTPCQGVSQKGARPLLPYPES